MTLPDGMRITYVEAGAADGPVVVFLHGTPSSRLQVSGRVQAVATDFGVRLLAPDRPGIGGSTFITYRVADYPRVVAAFLDTLGVDEFGVVGTSGGGRYACACASLLGDRVRRVALVDSTAPLDLPGARATSNKADRLAYTLVTRAPWLFRLWMAKLARDVRRDPNAIRKVLPHLAPADEETLLAESGQALFQAVLGESFRQGVRGVTHDYRLEALPWGVPLAAITAPVDIWQGRDDTLVDIEASTILAHAIPTADLFILDGEGHFSMLLNRADRYLAPFQ